jgi:polysaccharide export outer membrane protein
MLFTSCASKKDVLYFQDIQDNETIDSVPYEPIIKKNDLLAITVTAETREIAEPYNLPVTSVQNVSGRSLNVQQNQAYLVDADGYIEMPKLGMIKVSGLKKSEVINQIKNKLIEFIKTPHVNLRILNYNITIIGDVKNPGTFTIPDEKVTIIEAIGLAGDLEITGKRNEILVIRENDDGTKVNKSLDITKKSILTSNFYYLNQNDVVVVNPNNAKIQRSASNPNTGIFFSIASLLLSVFVIFSR